MKSKIVIKAESISKKFNGFTVFDNISFTIRTGEPLAITGPNGSGKTTLLEIIAGIQPASSGKIGYLADNIARKSILDYIGYLSPRINLYNELTAVEIIDFTLTARDLCSGKMDNLLNEFGLHDHRNKRIIHLSSGMRQRLKFLLAVINDPPALFLDEPGSNLDKHGKDIIYSYLHSEKKDKMIIIATNEKHEADFCKRRINLA